MAVVIPNPRIENGGELLTPGRKPVGNVVIDSSKGLAPNRLFILNRQHKQNIDLVTNEILTPNTGVATDIKNGELVTTFSVAGSSYKLPTSIQLSDAIPWEITFKAQSTGTGIEGMIIGDFSLTSGYIWLRTGFYLRYTASNVSTEFTSVKSVFTDVHTYTLTSDGGGAGSCTIRLYLDGIFKQSLGSAHGDILISDIGSGYNSIGFSFLGNASYVRVSEGRLYTDENVHKIYRNPYQFIIPA